MKVSYEIPCFDRMLVVNFPDKYQDALENIRDILNNSYDIWNNYEDAPDPEEREYIRCSCCEEYITDCLRKAGYEWEDWFSEEEEEF